MRAGSQAEALDLVEKLREPWLASLRAEGLDGSGAAFRCRAQPLRATTLANGAPPKSLPCRARSRAARGAALSSCWPTTPTRTTPGQEPCLRSSLACSRVAANWCGRPAKKLAGIDEVSDEQAAEDAVRMADESKHDERVGHFTPKGWSVVRRHRAALLKFAELAGAAGVDAVVQASKPPSLPSTGKPGAGACVAVQAAQGPQARGLGAACTPAEERPRRGPEASPEGPPGRGEKDIT